ncbi:MAG: dihydropteroate synthase, partial [Azonexus sp.]
ALFRALTTTGWNDLPSLVGVSRKSMLGAITGQPVERRVAASIAAAVLAARKGAKILRVHDVEETRDALAVLAALETGDLQ